ncbi:MAG: hypothetical protein LBS07_00960, partial [Prevotellaceae bacterium]|nr:hypothetical protein [Prevotellaceae bacterium]
MRKFYIATTVLVLAVTSTVLAGSPFAEKADAKLNSLPERTTGISAKKINVKDLLIKDRIVEINTKDAAKDNAVTKNLGAGLEGVKLQRKAAAADPLWVAYPIAAGSFFAGITYNLGYSAPVIVSPAIKDNKYFPFSNNESVQFSWSLNNNSVPADAVNAQKVFTWNFPPDFVSYIPKLTGASASETATY